MVGEDNKLPMKSKIYLSKLPPASDNLQPHIYRVNHRLAIYKRANEPIFWTTKPWPVLPQALMDILETTVEDLEEEPTEDECFEEEIDFEEMFDEELDDI